MCAQVLQEHPEAKKRSLALFGDYLIAVMGVQTQSQNVMQMQTDEKLSGAGVSAESTMQRDV